MSPYLMAASSVKPEGVLKWVLYGFVGLIAYKIYKQFTDNPLGLSDSIFNDMNKEEKSALKETSVTEEGSSAILVRKAQALLSSTKNKADGNRPFKVNQSHIAIANSIEKAMKGVLTDNSKIDVIKTMSPYTLLCVFIAYGVRSTELNWHYGDSVGNMIDHLQEDLSVSQFAKLRPYFQRAKLL